MSLSASHAGRPASATAGFTLIEVLIALFLLAIGLLGMSALQGEALKYNHAAFIDSQAQFLLNDMAKRIRANAGNNIYVIDFTDIPPTIAVNCETDSCTSNQMAIWDLNQWRDKVEDSAYLPQGESQIQFDNAERTFVLSIRYDWSQLGGEEVSGEKRTIRITTRIQQ